jgi:hypothetical protein
VGIGDVRDDVGEVDDVDAVDLDSVLDGERDCIVVASNMDSAAIHRAITGRQGGRDDGELGF